MSDQQESAPGLLLAGRYLLRSVLGRGGAGTVWLADDDLLDRSVAVKLLHPELEQDTSAVVRFRREATSAAALTHPNAVIVYDIGEDEGRVFLVMEYVDGVTLAELLTDSQLSPTDIATVGVSVGRALGAAHRRGLVHRDVKPGNVLINRDGVAKVVDFGIATALGDAQARLTVPGMVVGTSAYLAPEQLEGHTVDARADVYALGLVLHEGLTGQPAFSGGTAAEVAARRLASEVRRVGELVADVPEELDLAVQRATRRSLEQRFADGADMAAALTPLMPEEPASRLARLVADRLGPPEHHVAGLRHLQEPTVPAPAPAAASPTGEAASTSARHRTDPTPVAGAAVTSALPAGATESTAATDAAGAGVAADADPPAGGDPAPTGRRSSWSRPWPWIASLVIVALFAVAVLDVIQGDDDENGGEPALPEETPELAVVDGGDFDPFGSGDGEHPQDVPNAFDGNADTAWQTQRYNSATLGNLKPGVGMWVDLGDAAVIRNVELALRPAGADVHVYAADEPPPTNVDGAWTPADWGELLGEVSGSEEQQLIEGEEMEARYLLLWFTSLPADSGGHRVHVSDVTVTG